LGYKYGTIVKKKPDGTEGYATSVRANGGLQKTVTSSRRGAENGEGEAKGSLQQAYGGREMQQVPIGNDGPFGHSGGAIR